MSKPSSDLGSYVAAFPGEVRFPAQAHYGVMTGNVEIAGSVCHDEYFDLEYSVRSSPECLQKLKRRQKNLSWKCPSRSVANNGNSITGAFI